MPPTLADRPHRTAIRPDRSSSAGASTHNSLRCRVIAQVRPIDVAGAPLVDPYGLVQEAARVLQVSGLQLDVLRHRRLAGVRQPLVCDFDLPERDQRRTRRGPAEDRAGGRLA